MAFLQYYLKSSTKRGWEMSSLLVAIQDNEIKCHLFRDKNFTVDLNINSRLRYFDGLTEEFDYSLIH